MVRESLTGVAEAGAAASESTPEAIRFEVRGPFPDVYADSVQVAAGPYGLTLTFALTEPDEASRRYVVSRVRVSPQMGYVIAQLLRKIMRKSAEDGIGISVPAAVLESLGIEREL